MYKEKIVSLLLVQIYFSPPYFTTGLQSESINYHPNSAGFSDHSFPMKSICISIDITDHYCVWPWVYTERKGTVDMLILMVCIKCIIWEPHPGLSLQPTIFSPRLRSSVVTEIFSLNQVFSFLIWWALEISLILSRGSLLTSLYCVHQICSIESWSEDLSTFATVWPGICRGGTSAGRSFEKQCTPQHTALGEYVWVQRYRGSHYVILPYQREPLQNCLC